MSLTIAGARQEVTAEKDGKKGSKKVQEWRHVQQRKIQGKAFGEQATARDNGKSPGKTGEGIGAWDPEGDFWQEGETWTE